MSGRVGVGGRPGEPLPLPHRIGTTGWWWLGLGTIALLLWAAAFAHAGGALLPVDQRVLEALARLRTPAFTRAMLVVAALGSRWVIVVLGWAAILVLLAVRRFRHLLVSAAALLVQALATYLAGGILEAASPVRPAGSVMLGRAGRSASPLLPVATLSGRLVSVLYALVPQGRLRQLGKGVAAGMVAAVAVGRMYLAVDTPTGVLVASLIGVRIPLVAFRLRCPDEVFPVGYRRGRTAHLDVAWRRAVVDGVAWRHGRAWAVQSCDAADPGGAAGHPGRGA